MTQTVYYPDIALYIHHLFKSIVYFQFLLRITP